MAVCVLAIVGLVAYGYSLSPNWAIKNSITINAPAAKVYAQVNSLKQWQKWSTWTSEFRSTLSQEYKGPNSGPGAMEIWNDDGNEGITTITAVQTNQQVKYGVTAGQGTFYGKGEINLTAKGNATEVTWKYYGNTDGNIILRLIMHSILDEMDKGNQLSLERLKGIAEQP